MTCVQHGPVHPSSDVDEHGRLFIQPRVFPCNIQAFVRRTRVCVQDVVSKACTFPRRPRRTRVRVSCSCESPDVRYAHVDVPWVRRWGVYLFTLCGLSYPFSNLSIGWFDRVHHSRHPYARRDTTLPQTQTPRNRTYTPRWWCRSRMHPIHAWQG